MTPRANPAPAPAVEKSPSLSRVERAALAHKNAVENRRSRELDAEAANRKAEAAQRALQDANQDAIETAQQLIAAALGKPE